VQDGFNFEILKTKILFNNYNLCSYDLKLTESGIKAYEKELSELEYKNSEDDEEINDDK